MIFYKWYARVFLVISQDKAIKLGLKHKENIYGDLINKINCRSIWVDEKLRNYRVSELYNG